MDPKSLGGSLKVAILIQSLGKEAGQEILGCLNGGERALIKSHLSQMGKISPEVIEKVAEEFALMAGRISPTGIREYLAPETGEMEELGEADETEEEAVSLPPPASDLSALQVLDPDYLTELIKDEHPQTVAMIVVHLKPELASGVLSRLPDEIKTDVAFRIANLSRIRTTMIEEIDRAFQDVLEIEETSGIDKTDGIGRLAKILNQTDEISGEMILNEIEENDPELADQIRQRMFLFEDLPSVDDKGLQKLLRRVDMLELATALKAASDEVKQKVFRNMSERAGEMLAEEIEAIGAVMMKDVREAQQNIANIIREMEISGELVISGRRGEEFIA